LLHCSLTSYNNKLILLLLSPVSFSSYLTRQLILVAYIFLNKNK